MCNIMKCIVCLSVCQFVCLFISLSPSLSLSLSRTRTLSITSYIFDWFISISGRSNERKCFTCKPGNDLYKLMAYRQILEH